MNNFLNKDLNDGLEWVPRPTSPLIGESKLISVRKINTQEYKNVIIFLERQQLFDKSYHCRDVGVSIYGYYGKYCRSIQDINKRNQYISKHLASNSLDRLANAVEKHCRKKDTVLIEGTLYIGSDPVGVPVKFFYNYYTYVVAFFHDDGGAYDSHLWSFWVTNDQQKRTLLNFQYLYIVKSQIYKMQMDNFNTEVYIELLKKREQGIDLLDDEMRTLSNFHYIVYEQVAFRNKYKYVDLVDGCLNSQIGLAGGCFIIAEIREEIALKVKEIETNVELLEQFRIDPTSENFLAIEDDLFGLFEFLYDGFSEEQVLQSLSKIQNKLSAYPSW